MNREGVILKEFYKKVERLESNSYFVDQKINLTELKKLIDYYAKSFLSEYDKSGIKISARRAMIIVFENMNKVEEISRKEIKRKNVLTRAIMRYKLAQRDYSKLKSIDAINPEYPNKFYSDNSNSLAQYRKALHFILINESLLIDYDIVKKVLQKKHDLTK